MPLAHWDKISIFFAHVPKTGGSSVEDYLIRRFGPLSIIDVNKRTGVRKTGLIVPATHLAAVDLVELIPHGVAYKFAVVREPVARMMSEFRYQSNVSRMSRLGFSTWLQIMLHAARAEPRIYENHIRPQGDLVPEGSDVFRLEDGFEAMIEKLDEVAGQAAPEVMVKHLNKRPHEKLPLTRYDVDLITDFYAADYERFGYEKPDTTQLEASSYSLWRDLLARGLAHALVFKQRWSWGR